MAAITAGGVAAGAAVVGVATGIFSARSQQRQAKRQEAATQAAALGQQALTIEGLVLRRQAGLRQRSLERSQDEFLFKLRQIQTKQQAEIVLARQRSAAQVARTSGIGGSFTRVQTGESELQTEVQRQITRARQEKDLRQQQREFESELERKQFFLAGKQSTLTLEAVQAGARTEATAAFTKADIGAVKTTAGFVGAAAQNPAVVKAVTDFFGGASGTGGGTSPFVTQSNPLGLTSGQGL